MNMEESNRNRERSRGWLPWIFIPLILGILVSLAIPRPEIGVVVLNDAIYDFSAYLTIAQIRYARETPRIRAVVLQLNSPGGTVVHTESVYMELAKLREKKPVVTSVGGMAASGAYYLLSGTDYAFAKPTSLVGNVGVIGSLPPSPYLIEDTISTGPYKLWGSPRDTYQREIEMIKQGFYQAVTTGRGDRLTIGPETLLRGQIWPGTEALRLGLIDELGSDSDALEKAAQMAKVWNYRAVDLIGSINAEYDPTTFYATVDGVKTQYPAEPGLYLLYIPPLPASK